MSIISHVHFVLSGWLFKVKKPHLLMEESKAARLNYVNNNNNNSNTATSQVTVSDSEDEGEEDSESESEALSKNSTPGSQVLFVFV